MTRVPVYVPWHVSARDTVTRLVPTSPVGRAIAATIVAVVGSITTGLTLWIATRGDVLAVVTGLIGDQAREAATAAAGNAVAALFGAQAIAAMQTLGPLGIALAIGGFVTTSFATVFGLRLIATSSRARS